MPQAHTTTPPTAADLCRIYSRLNAVRSAYLQRLNAVPEGEREKLLEQAALADEALRKAIRAIVAAFLALDRAEMQLPEAGGES